MIHLSVTQKFHWLQQYSDPHCSTLPQVGVHTFVSSTAVKWTVSHLNSIKWPAPLTGRKLNDANWLNMNMGTEHWGSLAPATCSWASIGPTVQLNLTPPPPGHIATCSVCQECQHDRITISASKNPSCSNKALSKPSAVLSMQEWLNEPTDINLYFLQVPYLVFWLVLW